MLLNCRDFISEVCPAISDCFVVIFGGVQQGRVFMAFLTATQCGSCANVGSGPPDTHTWTMDGAQKKDESLRKRELGYMYNTAVQ